MRTLVVAMEPGGREGSPAGRALEGSATKRRVDRMLRRDLFEVADTVNLLPERGLVWDRAYAAVRAVSIGYDLAPSRYDRVLTLGRVVRDAFGFVYGDRDWFTPATFFGVTYTASPHPSGRSRWWNDAANRAGAERFYSRYFSVEG